MATLSIMDTVAGDIGIIWDPEDEESIEQAHLLFDEKINQGWLAYSIDPEDSSRGEAIREFDPTAEKIIMTPPAAGG